MEKKMKMEMNCEKSRAWIVRPVLANDLLEDVPLTDAFIGKLKNKQDISKAILQLGKILPCPHFLKRCSELRIFLATSSDHEDSPEKLIQFLKSKNFDMNLIEPELEIVRVPSRPPKTKQQTSRATRHWPVNFHPDLHLESLISGDIFSDPELQIIESIMKLVIEASRESVGTPECNGSALILDPDDPARILAVAASSVQDHPMWHASMIAVDLVAKISGGGAWKLIADDRDDFESKESRTKRKTESCLPLVYPKSLNRLGVPDVSSLDRCASLRRRQDSSNVPGHENGPYLCTNYWVFLLQEPCPMCAMALLHSRVARIFYGAGNERTGILGSRATLHSIPGLNHRYLVWRGVLEDECVAALKICKIEAD